MMMKRLSGIAALAALSGCATPTYFQPATSPAAVGYSDYRIEPGRYRVTFQGGNGAPAGQIADYVILRAAQLALSDGYDWFRIVGRQGFTAGPSSGSSLSVGGGGASLGRGGGVGIGLGASLDFSGGPRVTRSVEVLAGRGPRPPGPDVYDANAVARTIGPRAAPPPPGR